MAVQFCGTCGRPLIPDQLFCQHCGSRVDENATRPAPPASSASPVPAGGTLYCGECGALVGSQDRVCRRCGAPIEPIPGGISDPSLNDAPTTMGTPPPSGYAPQQPPGWAASHSPGPYHESPTFTLSGPRAGVQTPPYQPAGPGGPPRQRRRGPLALVLVLIALILIVGGGAVLSFRVFGGQTQGTSSTPTAAPGTTQTPGGVTPSPAAVDLTPETASALLRQYYAYINAKNYDAAYDLLSPEWQQTQTRQEFIDGYQNTIEDTLTIDKAGFLPDGTVEVDMHLQAQETGATKNFAGYYIVTKEDGKLLLLRAKVDQI